MSVVGDVADVVRAESVILVDAQHDFLFLVDDDQSLVGGGQGLESVLQVLHLVHVALNAADVGETALWQSLSGSPYHAVSGDFVYLLVADEEVYAAVALPYPLHFAVYVPVLVDGVQSEHAAFVGFYVSDVVVATGPDDVFGVAEYGGDAGDARCMYDAPRGVVVVEQTFEVGYVDGAVVARDDVEILVVCLVVGRAIVAQMGDAEQFFLGPCHGGDECHEGYQYQFQVSHGLASFPKMLS